jgi:curved DNA-binding protein CbpA
MRFMKQDFGALDSQRRFYYNAVKFCHNGGEGVMATLYEVLRVNSAASQVDIDRAYQRMVTESSYDTSINRKDIELAYRTLRDPTQRTLYDYSLSEDKKKVEITAKHKKIAFKREQAFDVLRYCVIGLFLIVGVFWWMRYGYHLKSYSVGDNIYYKSTDAPLGKIMQIQSNHSFGSARADGVLIQTKEGTQVWYPLSDLKSACYSR